MSILEGGNKQSNTAGGQLRVEWANNRLIVSKDNVDILLFGQRVDGSIGWDLSPDGVDVKTADLAELVASSRTKAFTIAIADTISVTRNASSSSGSDDVNTDALGAPMFLCTVSNPAGSPSFKQQTPFISFNSSGVMLAEKRALYDPSTGVIRFFVEANSNYPSFGTAETWEFQYFLLYQNIPT